MVYINECIDVNKALKKFLQIYELFEEDPIVSKKLPTLASPRLYSFKSIIDIKNVL
jgi:hypothetical protein